MQGPDGLFHIGDRRYGGKAGNSVCTVNGTSFFFLSHVVCIFVSYIDVYNIYVYRLLHIYKPPRATDMHLRNT